MMPSAGEGDTAVAARKDTGSCRWKLPALMALSFCIAESLLCMASAAWAHHWMLFAISMPGPVSLVLGSYFVTAQGRKRENRGGDREMDPLYRALLILACVYAVTYTFFYGLVQLAIRGLAS